MADEMTINVRTDSPEERAIVRSMLTILGSSTVEKWYLTDSPDADLVLLATSRVPPHFTGSSSRVVARLVNSEDPIPDGDVLVLSRPLRAMPFLELLNKAARRVRATPSVQAISSNLDAVPFGQFQLQMAFAQSMREIRVSGKQQTFALAGADGAVQALINPVRAAIASANSVGYLHEYLSANVLRFELRTVVEWELAAAHYTPQSLDVLCWITGKSLAAWHGLAPWLNKDAAYRMISWPDFGAIGSDSVGMKLTALLTKSSLTPLQLTEAADVNFSQVVSFFNSASLCGLLLPAPQIKAPGETPPTPQRGGISIIGRLRRKLGSYRPIGLDPLS